MPPEAMQAEPPAGRGIPDRTTVRAWFLGERLRPERLEVEPDALAPFTAAWGRGLVVVFRYGAVVTFGLSGSEEAELIRSLLPARHVRDDFETEALDVAVDPERREGLSSEGLLTLRDDRIERLQVVGTVLAKSVALAHYEEAIMEVLERVESLALRLRAGRSPRSGRHLLRELGDVLLIQVRTLARVEVAEKPEMTWDDAELDRLYQRLAVEYELADRDRALGRKLELISETAGAYLDLLHSRRSLHVEWLIVVLIAVEILIVVYDVLKA